MWSGTYHTLIGWACLTGKWFHGVWFQTDGFNIGIWPIHIVFIEGLCIRAVYGIGKHGGWMFGVGPGSPLMLPMGAAPIPCMSAWFHRDGCMAWGSEWGRGYTFTLWCRWLHVVRCSAHLVHGINSLSAIYKMQSMVIMHCAWHLVLMHRTARHVVWPSPTHIEAEALNDYTTCVKDM